MPITAVLSRTLHEALGDEAAADLVDWMQQVDTHRIELRELNELNYARIDSRFQAVDVRIESGFRTADARLSEVRHELRGEIGVLRMEMHDGIADARNEMGAGFAELKLAIANAELKTERRFADLLKWSFLFWCGTLAAAALTRWPR